MTYSQPPTQPAYQAPPPWNGFAIASLAVSIALWGFGSILGVIFGHIALRQIAATSEQGRGLAIAGLVIGYLGIVALILAIVAFLAFLPANITFLPY